MNTSQKEAHARLLADYAQRGAIRTHHQFVEVPLPIIKRGHLFAYKRREETGRQGRVAAEAAGMAHNNAARRRGMMAAAKRTGVVIRKADRQRLGAKEARDALAEDFEEANAI